MSVNIHIRIHGRVVRGVGSILCRSGLINCPGPFGGGIHAFYRGPNNFITRRGCSGSLTIIGNRSCGRLGDRGAGLTVLYSRGFSIPFGRPVTCTRGINRLAGVLNSNRVLIRHFNSVLRNGHA